MELSAQPSLTAKTSAPAQGLALTIPMRTVVFAKTAHDNPPHTSRAAAECESPARKCRGVKRNKFESPVGTTLALTRKDRAPYPCYRLAWTEVSKISDCPPFTVLRRMDNPELLGFFP